jgi:hypothetical protein
MATRKKATRKKAPTRAKRKTGTKKAAKRSSRKAGAKKSASRAKPKASRKPAATTPKRRSKVKLRVKASTGVVYSDLLHEVLARRLGRL